jgi:orotidine-5'-phosphate decarboxylase
VPELILALDLPRAADAVALLDQLPQLRWVKVGSILMTREGPDFVRTLTDRGLKVARHPEHGGRRRHSGP